MNIEELEQALSLGSDEKISGREFKIVYDDVRAFGLCKRRITGVGVITGLPVNLRRASYALVGYWTGLVTMHGNVPLNKFNISIERIVSCIPYAPTTNGEKRR